MSTSDIPPTTTQQQPRPTSPTTRRTESSGWTGWIVFAAIMLITVGAYQAIMGLVALFKEEYYLVGSGGLVVSVDYTVWGWVHLILGLVAVAAGFGLMQGRTWARVLAIGLAVLSALVNLAFLSAYPVWSVLIIAFDVIVLYALTVRWAETRT